MRKLESAVERTAVPGDSAEIVPEDSAEIVPEDLPETVLESGVVPGAGSQRGETGGDRASRRRAASRPASELRSPG